MIKTALKHWIFEGCINILFDRIGNNFTKNTKLPKIGDKFKMVRYRYPEYKSTFNEIFDALVIGRIADYIEFSYGERYSYYEADSHDTQREFDVYSPLKKIIYRSGKRYVRCYTFSPSKSSRAILKLEDVMSYEIGYLT